MPSLGTLLAKILRLPLSLIPPETEVRILRGPLRGKKWIAGAGPNAYWVGTYEVARVRAFANAIVQGGCSLRCRSTCRHLLPTRQFASRAFWEGLRVRAAGPQPAVSSPSCGPE